MTNEALIASVIKWGRDHHIDNPYTQTVKIGEEFGEICHEISRGHMGGVDIEDAIGDTLVTVIILADILDIDPMKALECAYNTIKDRKGVTKNGGFVKEENA